jgi:DNA-directed RNA polymerase specialized sigma24 family protein
MFRDTYERDYAVLRKIAYAIAYRLLNEGRGELSIVDDLAQEALLKVLETEPQSLELDMNKMWDTQRNMLARWRERGYKVQLWQVSWEAYEEREARGDSDE